MKQTLFLLLCISTMVVNASESIYFMGGLGKKVMKRLYPCGIVTSSSLDCEGHIATRISKKPRFGIRTKVWGETISIAPVAVLVNKEGREKKSYELNVNKKGEIKTPLSVKYTKKDDTPICPSERKYSRIGGQTPAYQVSQAGFKLTKKGISKYGRSKVKLECRKLGGKIKSIKQSTKKGPALRVIGALVPVLKSCFTHTTTAQCVLKDNKHELRDNLQDFLNHYKGSSRKSLKRTLKYLR